MTLVYSSKWGNSMLWILALMAVLISGCQKQKEVAPVQFERQANQQVKVTAADYILHLSKNQVQLNVSNVSNPSILSWEKEITPKMRDNAVVYEDFREKDRLSFL